VIRGASTLRAAPFESDGRARTTVIADAVIADAHAGRARRLRNFAIERSPSRSAFANTATKLLRRARRQQRREARIRIPSHMRFARRSMRAMGDRAQSMSSTSRASVNSP
jgi:hypothetical protein